MSSEFEQKPLPQPPPAPSAESAEFPLDSTDATPAPATEHAEHAESGPAKKKKKKRKKKRPAPANASPPAVPPREPVWQRVVLGTLAVITLAVGAFAMKVWLIDKPHVQTGSEMTAAYFNAANEFRRQTQEIDLEISLLDEPTYTASDVQFRRDVAERAKDLMRAANRSFKQAVVAGEQFLAHVGPSEPMHADVSADLQRLRAEYQVFLASANRVDAISKSPDNRPDSPAENAPENTPSDTAPNAPPPGARGS